MVFKKIIFQNSYVERKKDACVVLKNDFICIPDADSNGNLKEADKASLVFVKHLY